MKTAVSLLLLLLVGVSLSGCGTVCNLVGGIYHPETEPRVFGGVMKDFEVLSSFHGLGLHPTNSGGGKGALLGLAAILAIVMVDPTVSFVADVLTLPITVPLQNSRVEREQEQNRSVTILTVEIPPDPTTVDNSRKSPPQEFPPPSSENTSAEPVNLEGATATKLFTPPSIITIAMLPSPKHSRAVPPMSLENLSVEPPHLEDSPPTKLFAPTSIITIGQESIH